MALVLELAKPPDKLENIDFFFRPILRILLSVLFFFCSLLYRHGQISSPEEGEQGESLYASWHRRDNWTTERDAPRLTRPQTRAFKQSEGTINIHKLHFGLVVQTITANTEQNVCKKVSEIIPSSIFVP